MNFYDHFNHFSHFDRFNDFNHFYDYFDNYSPLYGRSCQSFGLFWLCRYHFYNHPVCFNHFNHFHDHADHFNYFNHFDRFHHVYDRKIIGLSSFMKYRRSHLGSAINSRTFRWTNQGPVSPSADWRTFEWLWQIRANWTLNNHTYRPIVNSKRKKNHSSTLHCSLNLMIDVNKTWQKND